MKVRNLQSDKKSCSEAKECIWSQAGVIRQQTCEDNYCCDTCNLDQDLKKAVRENRSLRTAGKTPTGRYADVFSWKEKIKEQPLGKQYCLHYMKGQIALKNCINDYSCINCDFDQYFHDQYSVHAVVKPIDVLDVNGFRVPQGYYYHRGHTWAKLEENSEVRLGIDDFAYHVLGPPDDIETPLLGKELKQGEGRVLFRRGSNQVSFRSPVSGIITAVNHKLVGDGDLAHSSPYTDGWILRVHATDLRSDLKKLSMGSETEHQLNVDIGRLRELIEAVDQPLAADGGNLIDDLYGTLPELGWSRLVEMFFNTSQAD